MRVTFLRVSCAWEGIFLKEMVPDDMRPPRALHTLSTSGSLVKKGWSLTSIGAKPSAAFVCGAMAPFTTAAVCSSGQPNKAWPDS